MPELTEPVGQEAALDWLRGLGDEVLPGLTIAPGELSENLQNHAPLHTKLLSDKIRIGERLETS